MASTLLPHAGSCPDSYKDLETFRNRLSEGTYTENSRGYMNVQLAVSIGLADSSSSGHRLYSSRGQCVLSFRRQFDETFVRQVPLQTFRISQVKGDGFIWNSQGK